MHYTRERIAIYVAEFALNLGQFKGGHATAWDVFDRMESDLSDMVKDVFPESGPESYFGILTNLLDREE